MRRAVKVRYPKFASIAVGQLRADNGHQVCKSDGGVAATLLPHCRKAALSPELPMLSHASAPVIDRAMQLRFKPLPEFADARFSR